MNSVQNSIPHHLPIDPDKFGFVEREKDSNGRTIKNRCGRDFFYYALHYFHPEIYSPNTLNPISIEKRHLFGFALPAALVWTGLSFKNIPTLLAHHSLTLRINSQRVSSYWSFMRGLLFTKPGNFSESIPAIHNAIDAGHAVGVDISLRFGGLLDHVMFVYGYDEDNLYVFDTHAISYLEYEKITPEFDRRFIMKLPLDVIRKRWTRWNRVWVISPSSPTSRSSPIVVNR